MHTLACVGGWIIPGASNNFTDCLSQVLPFDVSNICLFPRGPPLLFLQLEFWHFIYLVLLHTQSLSQCWHTTPIIKWTEREKINRNVPLMLGLQLPQFAQRGSLTLLRVPDDLGLLLL